MRSIIVLAVSISGLVAQSQAATTCISFRSGYIGNAPGVVGQSEDNINVLAGSMLTPIAMTAGNFAAAAGGPAAVCVQPLVWNPTLAADPLARWINPVSNPYGQPMSALYAVDLGPLVNWNTATSASLTIHWMVDDSLGDPSAFNGVFLNAPGNSLGLGGGNYATQTSATSINVPVSWLQANNTLYLYQAGVGAGLSGIIFSGELCVVPAPGTVGLAGLGGLAICRRRRR